MADPSTGITLTPTDKSHLLPNDSHPTSSDVEAPPTPKPRSTGTILLGLCAALAIILASCYIVFSAHQGPADILSSLTLDCSAALVANTRLRNLGYRNFTWPLEQPDCQAEIRRYFRAQLTKLPAPRAMRQEMMVRNTLLDRSLYATLLVTLALDVACTWGGLGGRSAVIDWLHTWMQRLFPAVNLAAAVVALWSNDYDVPSTRLPAALLVGVSARVLLQVLKMRFPGWANYFGYTYVAVGVYAMTQSPVAGAQEMDLALALTFVLGGRIADPLVRWVNPEVVEEAKKTKVDQGQDKEKVAMATT